MALWLLSRVGHATGPASSSVEDGAELASRSEMEAMARAMHACCARRILWAPSGFESDDQASLARQAGQAGQSQSQRLMELTSRISLATFRYSWPTTCTCYAVWAVETMPEILLAFSHGFGEMWHSDMISAFLPPFHANARIFRFDILLKSSILFWSIYYGSMTVLYSCTCSITSSISQYRTVS